MEIRANYVIVGAFSLAVLLAAGLFILWIGGKGKGVPITQYDILFNESVKGLSINNDVLFTGIKVGKVTEIKISRVTPGEVRVRVAITADTPVRQDSVAQLEVRGITGVSVIAISGGTADSPLMQIPEDGVGVIRYEPSPLASVFAQVPDVLASANHILARLEMIFSSQNAQSLTDILESVATISNAVAERSGTINSILLEVEKAGGGFNTLLAQANDVIANDIKGSSAAVNRIASRVDRTLSAMEPGVKQFSTQGLSDVRLLLAEIRNLVHTFNRIGQKIENDPRRFLFGEELKEYKAP